MSQIEFLAQNTQNTLNSTFFSFFLHMCKKCCTFADAIYENMKRIILMSLLSIFALGSCAGQGGEQNAAHITRFRYHYDGTIGGNSHSYGVDIADRKATITIEDMQHHDYGELTDTAGVDFIQALEALCAKHDVKRYDGFDKYNKYVCDGSGFSLSIRYDNGQTVDAHGMNEWPKGYSAFSDEMHELFRPYCERMYEAALQRKKDQGVSGPLNFIMMNFIQQGESGYDRYEVMLSRSSIRQNNFEMRVRSYSGEFFPKGEYNVYTAVPDEIIDWEAFAKLVKKHKLVQWMDWHKSAPDYNNCEWFQMSFHFENGLIEAMGTEHPEHYKAFRKDFLTLLQKTYFAHKNDFFE